MSLLFQIQVFHIGCLEASYNGSSCFIYSYTDDHRGQLIADVISNSDHITPQTHQPECQTPHYNKHIHQISPRCLTHFTIRHCGQLNMHYHQTTYPSSSQLTYDMNTDYNKTDGHSLTTRKLTGHNSQKTQSLLLLRPPYTPIYTLPLNSFGYWTLNKYYYYYYFYQHNFHKHHTDGRQAEYTKGKDA